MFAIHSSQAQRSLWLALSAFAVGAVFAGVGQLPGAAGAQHGAYASLAVGLWYGALGLAKELHTYGGDSLHRRGADRMVLRAMVAMTAGDPRLEPTELGTIRLVLRAVYGRRVQAATVRRLFQEASTDPRLFSRRLARTRLRASEDAAETALRSAAMVAAVEGPLLDRHAVRVLELADLLSVPRVRLAVCVRDALETASTLAGGNAAGLHLPAPQGDSTTKPSALRSE